MQDFLLSVVVPMYFEEEVVQECYKRLCDVLHNKYRYELIFVNDGSTDKTLPLLEEIAAVDKCVKVVSFARNFGHQAAVTAGIAKAQGDALVIIDADLQDPPELIPDMVKLWQQGHEVVYAKRKKRKGESKFKLITAKFFYRFLDAMTDIQIPTDTGDFRLIDRKVAEVFKTMPERNRFIRGMVSWIGFSQIPIEYERDERFAGETKYPLKKMLKFASDGIVSFSVKPLRLVLLLGFIATFIAFLLFLYAVLGKIFFPAATSGGWASLMATIAFFGGVQLLSLGIVGEYIARIYEESKDRPLYIVAKEINMDEKN
ncbi:MAG: glycosyltransferase [Clostridia bacterium]|nr:glycosyltransferase [Clostridia bacterium]